VTEAFDTFFLPDLYEFPQGSLPSPDGSMHPVRRLPPGMKLVAVGWLDGPNPFAKGRTDPGVVRKLLDLDESSLIHEGTRGWHTCYYCRHFLWLRGFTARFGKDRSLWDARPQSPRSMGHHLVRLGDTVFMCPSLLPHYVVTHRYRPPDAFQEAVLAGVFLSDNDLIHTGEDPIELDLERSLAKAVAQGDAMRVNDLRAQIAARRDHLRRAGRTSGFQDPDTGVWRDR
jgi:hypothetical protein